MNGQDHRAFAALEAANPVVAGELERELGDAGLDAARTRLDRRLEASREAASRAPAGEMVRRPRLRVAGAAAACLVTGAVALAALPSGDGRLAALDAAAAVAARQPAPGAATGGYLHLRVRQGGRIEPWPPGLVDGPSLSTTEFWVGPDGSGRILKTTSIGDTETPVGEGWKRTGRTWTRDLRFGAGRFGAVYRRVTSTVVDLRVDALPVEAKALAGLLRRKLADAARDDDPETGFAGGSRASSGEILIVIGQVLAHPLAPPDLRSALYEVAGTLDGVQVDDHVHDPGGRPATVIRLDETTAGTPNRYELFFDPRTSATLATQHTTVGLAPGPSSTPVPPDQAGEPRDDDGRDIRTTITTFTIYDQRGDADSVDHRP
jgi:hypothetical protein